MPDAAFTLPRVYRIAALLPLRVARLGMGAHITAGPAGGAVPAAARDPLRDEAPYDQRHDGEQDRGDNDRGRICVKPPEHIHTSLWKTAPPKRGGRFRYSYLTVRRSASRYFLKNSIYTMNASTASAAISPTMSAAPEKSSPSWFTMSAAA